MPDYTLGPAETEIREAHLYAQIPSGLTIAATGTSEPCSLRNDGIEPITIHTGGILLRQLLPGETADVPPSGHYVVTSPLNGRFTIRRGI